MGSRFGDKHHWSVILGGGDGLRLRPLTRLLTGDDRPKQFCRLGGEETLLARTMRRVAQIVPQDRTLLVLTKTHQPYYANALAAIPPHLMVVQPSNRGTLPAILCSLLRLSRFDQQAIIGLFPSDHRIVDEVMFTEKVTSAFAAAEITSDVILLGTAATVPEVEYGWIEADKSETGGRPTRVKRFWEKPSLAVAQTLLDRGCLWNTFVMIGRVDAFLELIKSATPRLYEIFQTTIAWDEADLNPEAMAGLYKSIEPADFSKGVLSEATEKLSVLSLGEIGWDDLGDPDRAGAMMLEAQKRKPADFVRAPDAASAPIAV